MLPQLLHLASIPVQEDRNPKRLLILIRYICRSILFLFMPLLGEFITAPIFVLVLVFKICVHSVSSVVHVLFKLFGLSGVEFVIGGQSLSALGSVVGIATCRGWRKRTQIEEMQAEDP